MTQDAFDRKSIRRALRDWGNSQKLGEHPLARLNIVEVRRRAANYGVSPIAYGVALRDVLQDALESLRPDAASPDPNDKRWRPYLILSQQYLHGRAPDYLIEQLGIARSTYDHDQAQALDTLGDKLRQFEQLAPEELIITESRHVPFLAPPRNTHKLIGRDAELRELKQHLLAGERVAIHGLPGVGKSALANALAYDAEVLAHFSDGVLWAGVSQSADVLTLLSAWGVALGLPLNELMALERVEDRAQVVQAAIGMRRMLLVIDDIWREEEALPFKIGGPHCTYLLATRFPKVALAFEADHIVPIHELSEDHAFELLAQVAPQVAATQVDEMRGLAKAAGGLALALMLMGRYLHREGHASQPRRLQDALNSMYEAHAFVQKGYPSTVDQERTMPLPLSTAILMSYDALSEIARQTLKALSIFPSKPNSFSEAAALAVCATSPEVLDELIDFGLLESSVPGRYMLHQSIGACVYTIARLADDLPFDRFVAYYTDYVSLHAYDAAALDPESANILAALHRAVRHDAPADLIHRVDVFYPFLEAQGLYELAATLLKQAEQVARDLDDALGWTKILGRLGKVAQRLSDYALAETYYHQGLELAQRHEEPDRIADLLQGLGVATFSRGEYAQAETYYQEALALAREYELHEQLSAVLANLGTLASNRGDHAQARAYFDEGLTLARATGQRTRVSALLLNLGVLHARRGERDAADVCFQESLVLARETGHRETLVFLLTNLGTLANDRRDVVQAKAYFDEALALARQIDDRARVSHLLANLGVLANAQKDYAAAQAYFEEGLAIARAIEHRETIALLLTNIGALLTERGDYAQAEANFRESLGLVNEMGHRRYISFVLNNWGELHLKQDKIDDASDAFERALEAAQASGAQEFIATAQFGLARTTSSSAEARLYAEQSLAAFEVLDHPRASEVRAWLTTLTP